jgi:hypothetical protein
MATRRPRHWPRRGRPVDIRRLKVLGVAEYADRISLGHRNHDVPWEEHRGLLPSVIERSAEVTAERRRARGRTVAEDVALWRAKYPDALVCTTCGVLVASRRTSYRPPAVGVAGVDVGAYICVECRRTAAEAERDHTMKVEQARRAGRASAVARQARIAAIETGERDETLSVPSPEPGVDALVFPAVYAGPRGGFRNTGGRPRKHSTNAARQRAYRARRRLVSRPP